MSDGSRAAITPRKTHSESRKMIGNASISARARSSPMIVPASSPTMATPPTVTSGWSSSESRMRTAASCAASSLMGVKNAATYEASPFVDTRAAPPPL